MLHGGLPARAAAAAEEWCVIARGCSGFWSSKSQPVPAPSRTHERVHESMSIAGKCAVCRKVFVSFEPPSMDRDFIVHGWLAAR